MAVQVTKALTGANAGGVTFFSASTGGFYDSRIHAIMPKDAVAITDYLYRGVLAGQAAGKIIQSDSTGKPVLVPRPLAAPLTVPQQAAAAINAGMALVCTGNAELNGTYDCGAGAQGNVQAVALYIQVNGKFPAGRTDLPWLDKAGAPHVFDSTGRFQAFATAMGDYVTHLQLVASGAEHSLPPQPVTIA
jgi:hypothetical protein